ncbi:hypothetical protein BE21_19035 [Sorangium cellulosum]|uniref:Secreted protein n=1 Tax=Sorangium cellulosum TaxID=56 RepID=A0A150TXA0_SORCE|nr:hypothetical protein BE21_19035 [Sorangium cellulosum]
MACSRLIGLAAVSLALAACGGSDTGSSPAEGAGGGGGAGAADGTGGHGGTGEGGGSGGGPAATAPGAPVLSFVMPMLGVLHVEWVPQPECDQIEAERKDPTHDYAVAFTVAGSKKAYMDSEATEDMEYTYRLRCKVGEVYSGYSNEMSGNPTDEESEP